MASMTSCLRLITILIAIPSIFAPEPTPSGVMFFGYELSPGDVRLFQYDIKTELAVPVFENWEYFNSTEQLGKNLLDILDRAVGPDNKTINSNKEAATGYFAPALRYSKSKRKMEPVDYNVPRSLVAMATTLGVYPYVYDASLQNRVDREGYKLNINPSEGDNIHIYHIINYDWKANTKRFRPIQLDNWTSDAKNSIEFIPSVHVKKRNVPSRILWAEMQPDSDIFDDTLSSRLSIFSQKSLRQDQITSIPMDPSLNPSSPSMGSVKLSGRSSRPASIPPSSPSLRSGASVSSRSRLSGAPSSQPRSPVASGLSSITEGSMLSVPSVHTATSADSRSELVDTRSSRSRSSVNTHRSSKPRSSVHSQMSDKSAGTEIGSSAGRSMKSPRELPLPPSPLSGGLSPQGTPVSSRRGLPVSTRDSVSSFQTQSTMPVAEVIVPPAPAAQRGTSEYQSFAAFDSPAPSSNGSGIKTTSRSVTKSSTTKSSRRGDSTA